MTREDAVVASRVGGGFGTPEENRRVEKAAIREARRHLRKLRWEVKSVEREKLGYDLECRRGREILRVEVKGIRGSENVFILTALEHRRAMTDPRFSLCLVTQALSEPSVVLVDAVTLKKKLSVVPLAFKATLADTL
jgi:hypothetical protein